MERVTFAATAGLEGNTLSGMAHVYGQRTLVGGRYVEFAPGAFDAALAKADVRAFWNHDTTLLLGRQSAGTLRLASEGDGLRYAIDLPDTSYAADMKALVDRGDLSEMSFGIVPGTVKAGRAKDGRPVQLHTSVSDIFDISPVSLPAFAGTSVELHSQGESMRTAAEIMADMESATEDAETFSALETELAEAQATDTRRARLADLRKPLIDGTPAVIRATPKGDAGEMFAFDRYLRTGIPNSDLTFAQSIGTTTEGGYAVPQGFLNKLTECRTAYGGFMNAAENVTTTNGIPLEWPSMAAEVSTRADIVAEGAASTAGADLVFGTVTLGAYKYMATGTGNVPLLVSVELLQDAMFDIGALVARKLGERIARKEAYDLVRGDGGGEPLGIMYGTDGDVATTTGAAMVPTYAQLLALTHKLDPVYRQGASWIMNDTTLGVLEGITDVTLGRPLFMGRDDGMGDSVSKGRLLGYPVVIDQAIADGANNVQFIGFGNWKEAYIVRHVKDVQVIVNPYTNSNTGQVAYNAWARMDGTVQNACAYVTMEGLT
jgi:HK97 family phage major capsid protein/HK97 family phage prohead protease